MGCTEHRKQAWSKPKPTKRSIIGRALQRARAELFERDPLCAECKRQGRVTLATLRDHVKPLAEGGLDVLGNTQGLCDACHTAKTQSESLRGRGGSNL